MQAIVTKYLGPTNTRGSRIKAKANAGSITVDWDYSISTELNHQVAAAALMAKLGWSRTNSFRTGWLPNEGGLVHVLISNEEANLPGEVLAWASESRDHGGNPYCYDFVKTAQTISGED